MPSLRQPLVTANRNNSSRSGGACGIIELRRRICALAPTVHSGPSPPGCPFPHSAFSPVGWSTCAHISHERPHRRELSARILGGLRASIYDRNASSEVL